MTLYEETAVAFRDKISDYDTESNWLYTFQAKIRLDKLEKSLERLYNAHCLSLIDFKLFDRMLFERQAKLHLK